MGGIGDGHKGYKLDVLNIYCMILYVLSIDCMMQDKLKKKKKKKLKSRKDIDPCGLEGLEVRAHLE